MDLRLAAVLLVAIVNAANACESRDVLQIYSRVRSQNDNCDGLTNSFGASFFNDDDPQNLENLCADECTLHFLWEVYVAGCSGHVSTHNGFHTMLEECGCSVDQFFVDHGGKCVSHSGCDFCSGDDGEGMGYVEPFLSTRGGSEFRVNVAGATLTLHSEQTMSGDASTSDEEGGFCDGAYVQWDFAKGRCVPKIEYMAAGTRLLPFHDLASKTELEELRSQLFADYADLESRIQNTMENAVTDASDIVSSNQRDIAEVGETLTDWQASVNNDMQEMREDIMATMDEALEEAVNTATSRLSELEESIGDIEDGARALIEEFEHTPFMDHSLPVYRWAVWSSYSQHHGWYNHNQREFFGGVHPSWWGDDWNRGRASDLNGNKDILRGLFNKRGYCGWQGTIWANEWYYYSSTNSKHVGTLFRIANVRSNNINWSLRFRYSSFGGWGERASVTLNGHDNWSTTGNCAYCDCHLNLNIPGGRTSTVVVIAGSNHPSGTRTNLLTFTHNSLRLPTGLEYRDDMDYADGGWEQ